MSKASQITFNGGEYTEFMDPRVDVSKYAKGCRKLENFYPLPFGAAMSRPGTVHGGTAKYSDKTCRLMPFTFSTTTTFDIELGHEYMRFWKDQEIVNAPTPSGWVTGTDYTVDTYVTSGSISYRCIVAHTAAAFNTDLTALKWEESTALEVTSPYQENELYQVQFRQVQDVVYITHPAHAIRKLTRYADNHWSLAAVGWDDEFNYPPLDAMNTTTTTVAISAPAATRYAKGEVVTLTASTGLFTSNQVGEMMMVGHYRDDVVIKTTPHEVAGLVFPDYSDSIYVLGDWSFQTEGTDNFLVALEESEDNATWRTKRSYDVVGTSRNILATGTEQAPKYFRIRVTSRENPPVGLGAVTIEVADPFVPGLVKITAVANDLSATATIVDPPHSAAATTYWKEQFFSTRKGHPRALCFHRNRLCLGSTDVWISQPGNYENFRSRNDADSGFRVALNKTGSPFVQWMEDLRELRIGTTQAEAVVISENQNEAFSYANYRVRWDSNYGSKHLPAETINGTALFLQPEGRTLRYQALTGIENYYDANTLTTLADHIAGEGIVETAYQRQRYPTYHGVRSDGQVASLLYEESQNIQAWHRMVTDGSVESISVTPRPDEEDRVGYVVKRTLGGTSTRHIEFKALNQYRTLQDNTIEDMWFVDDGIRFTYSSPTSTITGLGHLEGVQVAVLGDGAKMSERVVSSGSITLDYPCSKVLVGRPYDMTLEPMHLESSSVIGRTKNISGAIVRLWRSGAALIRTGQEEWTSMEQPPNLLDTAPSLYTGDFEKSHVSGVWGRNVGIEVKGRSPLPLNVQAITLEFEIGRG